MDAVPLRVKRELARSGVLSFHDVSGTDTTSTDFASFMSDVERPLRQALVAKYGTELGPDAFASAIGWAWEHRFELHALKNPVGYLYRVGQSSLRPQFAWQHRRQMTFPAERRSEADPFAAVDLGQVVARLSQNQRICVLLVHAHGWTYREVADLLIIRTEAVTNHVHRGTARLRKLLKDG